MRRLYERSPLICFHGASRRADRSFTRLRQREQPTYKPQGQATETAVLYTK